MKIEKINLYKTRIPFRRSFSHALSKGAHAENVVVEVIGDHGEVKGYGECAPRHYVTGETQDSVFRSISHFLESGCFSWDLKDVSQIWDFEDNLPDGREQNAALSALEMALLDALGKSQESYVLEYFPKDQMCESICYGAAIPMDREEEIIETCQHIEKMGISRIKVKMGKDFDENEKILRAIHKVFKTGCDLKIDVNGAWDRTLAFKHVHLMRNYEVKIVEQPMTPEDPAIQDFAEVIKAHNVMLMADESACSMREVQKLAHDGHYNMINVRLSKCGGFRRSFKIINHLREKKIPFQIACQLGESGLLSAAGRILSLLCRDAMYHDGSYDEFLLKENVTDTNIGFGQGGRAGPIGGCGLGVAVDRKKLDRLSDPSKRMVIKKA